MGGIALALLGGAGWVANLLFIVGLVLAWMAAVGYVINARRQIDARSGAPSGSP